MTSVLTAAFSCLLKRCFNDLGILFCSNKYKLSDTAKGFYNFINSGLRA